VFRRAILLALFCFVSSSAFAQLPISIGLKGGISLTDAYQNNTYPGIREYSDAKDYIIGPFIELRLPFGLGAEADALYRPLSFATQSNGVVSSTRYSTWEFPILAKYRFGPPIIKPFIDAGPSFRSTTSNTRYLSNKGFTLGAGLDIKALIIRVSPELRYTRWGSDAKAFAGPNSNSGTPPVSNVNQLEFLVGLAF